MESSHLVPPIFIHLDNMALFSPFSVTAIGVTAVVAGAIGIYRIFLHPLSRFPGPVLGATTMWYKAYFDIILDGEWSSHLVRLHETYGPIVRVAPNELHFSDPKVYNDIYGMGTKFAKHPHLYKCFGTDQSVFAMSDFHEATQRRNLIGPFFSRKAILQLENVVQTQVDELISRLLEFTKTGISANLDLAFRSTSLNVVTSYCFGLKSPASSPLSFENDVLLAIDATMPTIWLFKHFPLIQKFLLKVPEEWAAYLKPGSVGILEQRKQMGSQVDELLQDRSKLESIGHETIYHHLLNPSPENHRMPPVTRKWLLDEGLYLRFAGSDTVGNICTVGAYYLLTNPKTLKILVDELSHAWPELEAPMPYEKLEKLPYLTAVIKESLRMAHGVVTPLERVVGPLDEDIAGETIPVGTVVSMSSAIVHRDSDIFPCPNKFLPERWLNKGSVELDKYLVSFSKGPRSCLGINLAWCELYLIFGNVFRKLDLRADSPSPENIAYREYFVPIRRGRNLHAYVRPAM